MLLSIDSILEEHIVVFALWKAVPTSFWRLEGSRDGLVGINSELLAANVDQVLNIWL